MNRTDVRHALYRIKNGQPKQGCNELYALVESMLPKNESWSTFSTGWDVLVKDNNILIVKPETDYDYIHSTCLEYALCKKNDVDPGFDSRQSNIIAIVEGTRLEGKMEWKDYGKSWGLTVDSDRRFIHTKLFSTKINRVTDEMIASSVKSDGSPMTTTPTLPTTTVELTSQTLTPEQQADFQRFLSKKQKN